MADLTPASWWAIWSRARPHWRRLAAVAVVAGGVVAVMLLTSGQMSALRVAVPPLSRAMSWLEQWPLPLDMDHVAFFALVALALRLLLPGVRWWWLAVGIGVLALGTELLQFGTVGRTPALLDARDGMAGAVLGLLLGAIPIWLARRVRLGMATSTRVLLLAGVVLLPLQQWSPVTAFGVALLASDVLFAVAIGLRVVAWAGDCTALRLSALHGWIAAYVAAMGLACLVLLPDGSVAHAPACAASWRCLGDCIGKWVGVVYLAMLAVVTCDCARDPAFTRRLMLAWIAAAAMTALLSVCAIVGFYLSPDAGWLQPMLSHYGSLPPGDYPRVRSLFANANMLCNYLVVAVCLVFAARELGWIGRRAAMLVLVLLSVAALATFSPALGGLVLSFAVAAWWRMRKASPRMAGLVLAAGALLAVAVLAGMWVNLAAPFREPSVRVLIWQQAWQTWLAHPWRGVGLGMDVVGVAYLDPSGGQQWLTDAHNIWLNVAGQAGLIGVLALAGLCGWLVWHGVAAARAGESLARYGLLAFVAAFLYSGLTGSFEDARHLWLLIGLLGCLASPCRSVVGGRLADGSNPRSPSTMVAASRGH